MFPLPVPPSLREWRLSGPQVKQKEAGAQAGGLPGAYQSELKSKSLRAWDSRSDVSKAGIHIPDSPSRIQLWALGGRRNTVRVPLLHLYHVERMLVKNPALDLPAQHYCPGAQN